MAAKMLAATQNINTNKQNQLKITETLISNFAAVLCIYWYTGLPLVSINGSQGNGTHIFYKTIKLVCL